MVCLLLQLLPVIFVGWWHHHTGFCSRRVMWPTSQKWPKVLISPLLAACASSSTSRPIHPPLACMFLAWYPPQKHPAQSDDVFEGQMKWASQHRQTSIRKSCVSFMRMLFCMLLYFLIIVMRCDCLLVTHNTSWGLSPGNSCQHLLIWQKATN